MDNHIFESIIKEADTGRVEIVKEDALFYNIAFHTKIGDEPVTWNDSYPVLHIRNWDTFLNLWKEYVKTAQSFYPPVPYQPEEVIKKYASTVFSNATLDDFEHPELFLKRRISFLKQSYPLEPIEVTESLSLFLESYLCLRIEKQDMMLETPYAVIPFFKREYKGEMVTYDLPTIRFGIANNEVYLYAIQNKQQNPSSPIEQEYQKKLKRTLYQVNQGIMEIESPEYQAYYQGESTYHAENISEVSPSAIVGLTTLFTFLVTKGITDISVIPFLPLRYHAKEQAGILKAEYVAKKNPSIPLPQALEEMKQHHQQINENIIDKWIRNFFRIEHHCPTYQIYSYPYIEQENMKIHLDPPTETQGKWTEEIITNWKGDMYVNHKTR